MGMTLAMLLVLDVSHFLSTLELVVWARHGPVLVPCGVPDGEVTQGHEPGAHCVGTSRGNLSKSSKDCFPGICLVPGNHQPLPLLQLCLGCSGCASAGLKVSTAVRALRPAECPLLPAEHLFSEDLFVCSCPGCRCNLFSSFPVLKADGLGC